MKLTAREQSTLSLMCDLASRWEATLADSCAPRHGSQNSADSKKQIIACRRNIAAFQTLTSKLVAPPVVSSQTKGPTHG